MADFIGDIFSLNDVYDRQTIQVDSAVVEVQEQTGLTVTATAGSGTVATLTYAAQTVAPFPVGSIIAVFGVVPVAYCGTFRVRTCTTTQVTYLSTATGALTTGGTVLLVTESIIKDDLWSSLNSHGWFGGGNNPGTLPISAVNRIDFSNDSSIASVRGPLSAARYGSVATGNSNYGWFGGGSISIPTNISLSTIDRIDFSNDSSTASVRGPLSVVRASIRSVSNFNYGWFGAGSQPFPVPTIYYSLVNRVDFSNDSSTASVRGPLTSSKSTGFSVTNSDFGWFCGGFPGSVGAISTVDRIDFSNDSATASVRAPLSVERRNSAATGNSNYGWFGGGFVTVAATTTSTVERIDFSNDLVVTTLRGPLNASRANLTATGNSNYGWFNSLGSTGVSRIDFSNDLSASSNRGSLGTQINGGAGATSGQAKSSSIRPLRGGDFGWWGGGGAGSFGSGATNTVDRINFSNDLSTASVRGSLSLARFRLSAVANSNYGWFGGGDIGVVPGNRTTVDRIDFSNDLPATSVRGPLLFTCERFRGTGNSNYGWFALDNQTQRIDFSNDSSQGSSRGQLNASRYGSTLLGNSGYGWVVGGRRIAPNINYTLVERIDFSNDSSLASIRGPLNQSTLFQTSTANSNYGWVGGGIFLSPTPIQRMDFSNDSATSIIRGPVSLPRSDISASGNANYGWFVGGTNANPSAPAYYSLVDRIDFSNDSSISSLRGPLSAAKGYATGACSNTPIG